MRLQESTEFLVGHLGHRCHLHSSHQRRDSFLGWFVFVPCTIINEKFESCLPIYVVFAATREQAEKLLIRKVGFQLQLDLIALMLKRNLGSDQSQESILDLQSNPAQCSWLPLGNFSSQRWVCLGQQHSYEILPRQDCVFGVSGPCIDQQLAHVLSHITAVGAGWKQLAKLVDIICDGDFGIECDPFEQLAGLEIWDFR